MEKIFQIKLAKVAEVELTKFFDITRNVPDHFEKFYVLSLELISTPTGFYSETEGNGVYNSDHQLIGDIITKEFNNCTIVTFCLKNNKQRQELLEFIESTIDEMKFAGFTILETRDFGGDKIDINIDKKPYIPKTKAALDKWKKCYKVISAMDDEVSESDEWELKPPTLSEYHDRIINELNIEYCLKTISRIIKAGEAGLLN